MAVYASSFPSGHAMTAGVVYLTLAAVLIRVETRRRLKAYLLSLAVLVTVAVGASRVYLAVHWPSDVVAGRAPGAAWAMRWWCIALWMQSRGTGGPGPGHTSSGECVPLIRYSGRRHTPLAAHTQHLDTER